MKLNSFRFKIALLTGLTAGVLLIGAGWILWRVSYQFNLEQIDRELRNIGRANLDRVQGGDHWARLDEALRFVAGAERPSPFVLRVKHNDKWIYQSQNWPTNLPSSDFSASEKYEGSNALRPGDPVPQPPRRGEPISRNNPPLPLKSPVFLTQTVGVESWRVGVMGNPYMTLVIAAKMNEFDSRMAGLRYAYCITLSAALVLVAGGAWLVARRALRPVTTLTETAERLTAQALDQRLPTMAGDAEFNRLITVFNEMLNRLETSFTQAKRFSADASHELKTPLARLQLELEQAFQSAPVGSSQQELFGSLLEEVTRLHSIVQKLLLLAQADSGRLSLQRTPVNLTTMLANVIEDVRLQAPHLTVTDKLDPHVEANVDPILFEQVLQNLASNAIKYNCKGGTIWFELTNHANKTIMQIANTGAGIPNGDREKVFERFYRADKSRNGAAVGTGLGLSLSREIVRAHGGELRLGSGDADRTQFVLQLPMGQAN